MSDAPVILLVGGTGFVGRHLAPALWAAFPAHRHVMLCRTTDLPVEDWQVEYADLFDHSSLDAAIERLKPDILVHIAAQASIDAAVNAAEMTWQVNFFGTYALAKAMAQHAPTGTVFFTSSAEVYGRSFLLGKATEETPVMPGNPYARSKLAAEYALEAILEPDAQLIIARPFNHTGPGQDERFAIPSFAAQIARIEAGLAPPFLKVGDLDARRDFLHVADVVDAYVRLLKAPDLGKRVIVNVASGHGWRIGDLLDRLCALSSVSLQIESDPLRMRPSSIAAALGDAERLRALTGWSPFHSIGELLVEMIEWWRDQIGAKRSATGETHSV